MKTLDELNAQGVTIVMVTHNDELGRRAKRVLHLQDGHILNGQHVADDQSIGELSHQTPVERRRA